ncbi:MAG: glycosyltransferase family 39 protein, partial [Verrucomicrobiota bacterium]
MIPTGLQDWIYKLEEGEGARWIKGILAILGLVGLALWYQVNEFKNFATVESMDAAQVARNLAQGKGFTTDYIRPVSLYLVQEKWKADKKGDGTGSLDTPHPDLANAPVYPLFLAALMKGLPFQFEIPTGQTFSVYQPERLIAIANQVLFFVCILLVFLLGKRLFDFTVAIMSAALMAGADLLWKFTVSGQSTLLLMTLFLGLIWCLVVTEQNAREEKKGTGWLVAMAVLAGVLTGLGALTRYSFGWLIVPVGLYFGLFFGTRRVVLLIAAALSFVVVMTPWVVRNYQASGTLFGVAGFAIHQEAAASGEVFSGTRLERTMTRDLEVRLNQLELKHYIRKLLVNSAEQVQNDLPKLGGSWLTAFFLAGLLVPFVSPALSRLRMFALGCLATLFVAQALGKTFLSTDTPVLNSENLLVLMTPVVILFGSGIFIVLLDQITFSFPPMRAWAITGSVVVFSAPLILTLLPPASSPHAYPPYHPPLVQHVADFMKPDELMMSDIPWAVAWYGNRQCVWLTLDAPEKSKGSQSDFFRISDYEKPILGIYFTPRTIDARFLSQTMTGGPEWVWSRFFMESLMRASFARENIYKYL